MTNATHPAAFAMLRTPRHAFGADNLLGHVFESHLGVPLANRCHRFRLFHLHCRLPTSSQFSAELSAARRGYGEAARGGGAHGGGAHGRHHSAVPGHGAMAKLIMAYDLERHSWEQAKAIVRRQWKPLWADGEMLRVACSERSCAFLPYFRLPPAQWNESEATLIEWEEAMRRDPAGCRRRTRRLCAPRWRARRRATLAARGAIKREAQATRTATT